MKPTLFEWILAGLLLPVALIGCLASEDSTTGSKAPPVDPVTGTLMIDGVPREVAVDARWDVGSTAEGCASPYGGSLYVELTLVDQERPTHVALSIPFDGQNFPIMPVDIASYTYRCAGANAPGPTHSELGYYVVNGDPATEEFHATSGQVTLEAERDGTVVMFRGQIMDVTAALRDGTRSVQISGSFEDEGTFTDGTDDKAFTP